MSIQCFAHRNPWFSSLLDLSWWESQSQWRSAESVRQPTGLLQRLLLRRCTEWRGSGRCWWRARRTSGLPEFGRWLTNSDAMRASMILITKLWLMGGVTIPGIGKCTRIRGGPGTSIVTERSWWRGWTSALRACERLRKNSRDFLMNMRLKMTLSLVHVVCSSTEEPRFL